MVNLGPSEGCHTCKARRIKCDQGKPECQRCLRSGRSCGGYEQKPKTLRFRHYEPEHQEPRQQQSRHQLRFIQDRHSHRLHHSAASSQKGNESRGTANRVRDLGPPQEQLALGFFVRNFATLGRDMSSTRGFFELIPAVLSTEAPGSPLSLAITAVSMRLWRAWSAPTTSTPPYTNPHLAKAAECLLKALDDPVESKRPGTIIAATALQLDESVYALGRPTAATRMHHQGALALAEHQSAHATKYAKYVMYHIFYTEVTFAIRQKRPVDSRILGPVLACGDPPETISVRLDLLGTSVADLQWRALRPDADRSEILSEGEALLGELQSWQEFVPVEWYPSRVDRVPDTDPPIITHRTPSCDVYLSVQVASIWNTWRCYYLVLLRTMLSAASDGASVPGAQETWCSLVQGLVDGVCDSIPFFLGNCTWPLTFTDISSPAARFPSSHDLDKAENLPRPWCGEVPSVGSRDDHARHAVAQGAWHMGIHLPHLLDLLSGPGRQGGVLGSCLRPGQKEWIRTQRKRVLVLLHAEEDELST